MKCWLNGPVVVTPGTAKYQSSGDTSMKTPFATAATPSSDGDANAELLQHGVISGAGAGPRYPPGRAKGRT